MPVEPMLLTKRNKSVVIFDSHKIQNSINKARIETQEFEEKELETVTNRVLELIEQSDSFDELNSEDVREFIKTALIEEDRLNTAVAYESLKIGI